MQDTYCSIQSLLHTHFLRPGEVLDFPDNTETVLVLIQLTENSQKEISAQELKQQ